MWRAITKHIGWQSSDVLMFIVWYDKPHAYFIFNIKETRTWIILTIGWKMTLKSYPRQGHDNLKTVTVLIPSNNCRSKWNEPRHLLQRSPLRREGILRSQHRCSICQSSFFPCPLEFSFSSVDCVLNNDHSDSSTLPTCAAHYGLWPPTPPSPTHTHTHTKLTSDSIEWKNRLISHQWAISFS